MQGRIKRIREEFCNDSNKEFAEILGVSTQYASNITKKGKNVGEKTLDNILEKFPMVDPVWLKMGVGKMLKSDGEHKQGKLIPFFDDVATVGGNNDRVANMEGVSHPTEYIDTGDWFTEATAAIRHYGDSMVEYPEGCILAIKEVNNRELVVPGRDYVIETSEYRVTKRVQRGKDGKHITLYSTNDEKYSDGRLVHEPFDVAWNDVARISLVLGYVVKKNGGTIVFSKPR